MLCRIFYKCFIETDNLFKRDHHIFLIDKIFHDFEKKEKIYFIDCIREEILEKREGTVVLVSHDPVILSRCDKVVVLDKGKISQYGKYREIVKKRQGLCYQLITQGQFNDLEQDKSSIQNSPDRTQRMKILKNTESQKVELMVLEENDDEEDD